MASADSTRTQRLPQSLLGHSAGSRLALTAALLAVLWLAVYWSLI